MIAKKTKNPTFSSMGHFDSSRSERPPWRLEFALVALLWGVLWLLLVGGMSLLTAVWICAYGQDSYRTRNFVVSGDFAQEVAEAAEAERVALAEQFLDSRLADWAEPVLVRASKSGGGDYGAGATAMGFAGGRFVGADCTWRGDRERLVSNVVPHEVLHLVLASHFGRPLPRWYDEGAACAVESSPSQGFHRVEAVKALSGGRGIPFNRMLSATEYPQDVGAFYAQSHSAASWLLLLEGPRQYVRFGEVSLQAGDWSVGLSQVYGIRDASDFQLRWLAWLRDGGRWDVGKYEWQAGRGWVCTPQWCAPQSPPVAAPSARPVQPPMASPLRLSVGAVTTLPPGSPASVALRDLGGAYVLDFGMPQGQPGEQGERGPPGQAAAASGVEREQLEALIKATIARQLRIVVEHER